MKKHVNKLINKWEIDEYNIIVWFYVFKISNTEY